MSMENELLPEGDISDGEVSNKEDEVSDEGVLTDSDGSDVDEEEDDAEADNEMKGFLVEDEEEAACPIPSLFNIGANTVDDHDDDSSSNDESDRRKKRGLDEDDLDLLEQNLGKRFRKDEYDDDEDDGLESKKRRRLRKGGSEVASGALKKKEIDMWNDDEDNEDEDYEYDDENANLRNYRGGATSERRGEKSLQSRRSARLLRKKNASAAASNSSISALQYAATSSGMTNAISDEQIGILVEMFGSLDDLLSLVRNDPVEAISVKKKKKNIALLAEPAELRYEFLTESDRLIKISDIPERLFISLKDRLAKDSVEEDKMRTLMTADNDLIIESQWIFKRLEDEGIEFVNSDSAHAGIKDVLRYFLVNFLEPSYICWHKFCYLENLFVIRGHSQRKGGGILSAKECLDDIIWRICDLSCEYWVLYKGVQCIRDRITTYHNDLELLRSRLFQAKNDYERMMDRTNSPSREPQQTYDRNEAEDDLFDDNKLAFAFNSKKENNLNDEIAKQREIIAALEESTHNVIDPNAISRLDNIIDLSAYDLRDFHSYLDFVLPNTGSTENGRSPASASSRQVVSPLVKRAKENRWIDYSHYIFLSPTLFHENLLVQAPSHPINNVHDIQNILATKFHYHTYEGTNRLNASLSEFLSVATKCTIGETALRKTALIEYEIQKLLSFPLIVKHLRTEITDTMRISSVITNKGENSNIKNNPSHPLFRAFYVKNQKVGYFCSDTEHLNRGIEFESRKSITLMNGQSENVKPRTRHRVDLESENYINFSKQAFLAMVAAEQEGLIEIEILPAVSEANRLLEIARRCYLSSTGVSDGVPMPLQKNEFNDARFEVIVSLLRKHLAPMCQKMIREHLLSIASYCVADMSRRLLENRLNMGIFLPYDNVLLNRPQAGVLAKYKQLLSSNQIKDVEDYFSRGNNAPIEDVDDEDEEEDENEEMKEALDRETNFNWKSLLEIHKKSSISLGGVASLPSHLVNSINKERKNESNRKDNYFKCYNYESDEENSFEDFTRDNSYDERKKNQKDKYKTSRVMSCFSENLQGGVRLHCCIVTTTGLLSHYHFFDKIMSNPSRDSSEGSAAREVFVKEQEEDINKIMQLIGIAKPSVIVVAANGAIGEQTFEKMKFVLRLYNHYPQVEEKIANLKMSLEMKFSQKKICQLVAMEYSLGNKEIPMGLAAVNAARIFASCERRMQVYTKLGMSYSACIALGVALHFQDPVAFIASLYMDNEEDMTDNPILSLSLHPLQSYVPPALRLKLLERGLISSTSLAGYDLQKAIRHPNSTHAYNLQFVPGFGSRKARYLLQQIERDGITVNNSVLLSNWLSKIIITNSSSFLRFGRVDDTDIDAIDRTRISGEFEKLVEKLAREALELPESDKSDPIAKLLLRPDKLDDVDKEALGKILVARTSKTGIEKYVDFIFCELKEPFKERRYDFQWMDNDEIFYARAGIDNSTISSGTIAMGSVVLDHHGARDTPMGANTSIYRIKVQIQPYNLISYVVDPNEIKAIQEMYVEQRVGGPIDSLSRNVPLSSLIGFTFPIMIRHIEFFKKKIVIALTLREVKSIICYELKYFLESVEKQSWDHINYNIQYTFFSVHEKNAIAQRKSQYQRENSNSGHNNSHSANNNNNNNNAENIFTSTLSTNPISRHNARMNLQTTNDSRFSRNYSSGKHT